MTIGARKISLEYLPSEYSSEYLRDGFAKESPLLHAIHADLEQGWLEALLNVENHYVPNYSFDNVGFHLSDITSYRAIGQLVVAYNCIKTGQDKEYLGELWQMSYSVENRRAITTPINIPIKINCTAWVAKRNRIYEGFEFDIADRSFKGTTRCVISNPLTRRNE
jgi:hypothetical protein